jgi:hypothetical protein
MRASRGMGAINPAKMPGGKKARRKDGDEFTMYAEGGKVGLYDNIHAKRARGGKMRKPGSKGAPSAQDFINAAKTAKK